MILRFPVRRRSEARARLAPPAHALAFTFAVALVLWTALPGGAAAGAVTIRIAHWLGGAVHGSSVAAMMEEVAAYLEPYDIEVETIISGTEDYDQKVVTQTAGGVGPDVIFALPYSNFVVQELLIDLTPYLERDPELNFQSFVPVVWDIFTYDGATKLLPVGVSPYLMFYNRQHFQEAGMPYPDPSWTWARDIPEALRKFHMTDGEGNVTRYGLLLENRPWTLFFSQGGEVFSPDGSRSVLHESAAAADLLAEVYRWQQERLIPSLANHRPTFANGLGAIHGVMGTFAFPFYQENAGQIDWSITLPPRGAAGLRIDENVNGWGINMHSKNPDEAWIVLKALATISGRATMEVLGHFSPIIGKTDEATVRFMEEAYGLTPEEVALALDAINYVRPRFRHPRAPEITSIAQGAFNAISRSGAAPGPTLEDASARIDAILRESR